MVEERPKVGSVVHAEWVSKEPEKTRKFYRDAFGWRFQEVPEMNYSMIETPGDLAGGLRRPADQEAPGTVTYILVENIDEALRTCERAGARILMPKEEVPGMGWMGMVFVPGGLTQGLWEASPPQPP